MSIKKLLLGSAILLMAVLMITSVSNAANEEDKMIGFDDKEIRIAQLSPQTGPAAPWGVIARATGALFQMINDEGGIHGRKIKYYIRDDQYNPAQAKTVAKEVVEKNGIFAFVGGCGTSCQMAYKDYLIQKGIVWVSPATGGKEFKFPKSDLIFSLYPVYEDEGSILAKYIVEELKIKKIGMIYQNDPYGKDGLLGVQKRLAKYGMKLVAEIPSEPTEKDFSSHVMRLKQSGAEAVVMFIVHTPAVITLKTAAAINYKPKWLSTSTLSDMPMMYKISDGLWEGVITAAICEPVDADTPLMNKYRAMHKKYTPQDRWGVFYLAGIVYAEPLVDALQRVGPNLSAKALTDELNKTKNFKGIGPYISWTPNQHQGVDSVMIQQCGPKGSTIVLKDWSSNDLATWK
jgi:ABC-type branched-subunit amino acid transport system substrate-binding protein